MRRLALLDLDNTLIDRAESFARWSADFAVQRGLPAAEQAWLVETDGDGFVPRSQFFSRVRERYGLTDPVEHLWADYRATYPTYVRIRAEVLDALAGLHAARFRLGIVTNGTAQTQRAKIDRTGLAARVDAVCVSEEVAYASRTP
jgi:putative hydrolase of the HAD superfamily